MAKNCLKKLYLEKLDKLCIRKEGNLTIIDFKFQILEVGIGITPLTCHFASCLSLFCVVTTPTTLVKLGLHLLFNPNFVHFYLENSLKF